MANQPFMGENWDLELTETGDLKMASDSVEVAEHIKQRLQFFLEEWRYDLTAGIPYFQKIFTRPADKFLNDAIFKREILQTPGVTELLKYESFFNADDRVLRFNFTYTDTYGELNQQHIGLVI
jgi:hypothetical protein